MKKNNYRAKISMKETIVESWDVLKNNYQSLIKYALLMMILESIIVFARLNVRSVPASGQAQLVEVFLMVLEVILGGILSIGLILYVDHAVKGTPLEIKDSFNKAKEKIWSYVGNSILLGIVMAIPLSIISILVRFRYNAVFGIYTIFPLISFIYMATIGVFLTYPLILVCVDKAGERRFGKSIDLVKGNWIEVFVLTFLFFAGLKPIINFNNIVQKGLGSFAFVPADTYIYVNIIFIKLVVPVVLVIQIVLLYKLAKGKNIGIRAKCFGEKTMEEVYESLKKGAEVTFEFLGETYGMRYSKSKFWKLVKYDTKETKLFNTIEEMLKYSLSEGITVKEAAVCEKSH